MKAKRSYRKNRRPTGARPNAGAKRKFNKLVPVCIQLEETQVIILIADFGSKTKAIRALALAYIEGKESIARPPPDRITAKIPHSVS